MSEEFMNTENAEAPKVDDSEARWYENLKAGFIHVRAQARGAAFHLLVQNTAAYFTQEHDVTDRRNIDAGRQQVDGYHNIGQPLFIEAGDHAVPHKHRYSE